MKRFLAPLLALILGFSFFSSASAQTGLPLDRHYVAREGTTWIFTQEIQLTGDVTFMAAYQRGYKNKPISQLQFVRFTLTTPKETPIWDDLQPNDCFFSYCGRRVVIGGDHARTGKNDSEDLISLRVPVADFRRAVTAGKFFISIKGTSYPVYGPVFNGLRQLVASMGAQSSQSIVVRQAAKNAPKPVRLSARARRAAQTCLQSLKRVESALDGGANYFEYGRYIVDAQITLDQYLPLIPESQVRTFLSRSLDFHKEARKAWGQVSGDYSDQIVEALRNGFIRQAVRDRIQAQNLLR